MSDTGDARDAQQPTGEAGRDPATADGAQEVHADFGSALRKARERAGLSAADIADVLKVTQRTVDALEAERYEELPPGPFVVGYVRRYARLVGLDAAAVTVSSDSVEAAPIRPVAVRRSRWMSFNDFARESWGLVYGSILLVFVVLVGGALWWAWRDGNAEQTVPEAPPNIAEADSVPVAAAGPPTPQAATEVVSTVPAAPDQAADSTPVESESLEPVAVDPAPPDVAPVEPAVGGAHPDETATQTAAGADPGETATETVADADTDEIETEGDGLVSPDLITFVFEGECWVEVRDRGGDVVHGDLGREGETVTVSGRAPFSVLLGDPTVVDVTFNGERVAVDPGRSGEVARFQVGADDGDSATSDVVRDGG